ncbi:MAG: FAD-dependent oxidoreductase, partial [Acidimicrobiales bacterium]
VWRFKDPMQAERALEQGHCDLVGMVRGQIADPDLVAKARAARAGSIRLCLSCNQECVGRMGLNRWLGCIENPHAGREALDATRPRAPRRRPRRVLVVGAGPAGLQAAISAARGGHEVTVLERLGETGGQLRLAASVPNRAELGDLVRNQMQECRELTVRIELGVTADASVVLDGDYESVVLATGSVPAAPWWVDRSAGVEVADVTEVLTGSASPTGKVLVVDELGFHQATSVAELLADRGCSVEIVTPAMVVGQDLGITLDMEGFQLRAAAREIVQSTDRVVMGMSDGAVRILHHPTGRDEERRVDWVVLAVPPKAEASLYFVLSSAAPALAIHRVGDCVAPRRAHAAVIEGDRIGAAL